MAPATATYAYSDSEDDEEPAIELIEVGRWRRGPNGNLERIPSNMSPEAIANRAAGIPEGIIDRPAGIPSWADHPHRYSHILGGQNRVWCMNRQETCWWYEKEG